ncbi:hypothetical protein M569_07358 [Genlisea aurea]|uniref:Fungal lipase-like domain-containing protein n=1 Tax=Genlisea aurea TaxID=192259 RepID=S8CRE5_9LAMI|nr:hypothetical protein M569_07358 [Genlisea aurea]
MSVACCVPFVECVSCLACLRWVWKKLLYTSGRESETWGVATAAEFEPVPRLCRYILSVYEDDLRNPIWAPPGGYGMDPDCVLLKKDYGNTNGQVSPYMVYLDHENADIVLAIRGLDLAKESDFLLLLDNRLGQTTYDGGYVHNGLLKAAEYVLQQESSTLTELVEKYPDYTLTFAGHSLGAGVVTLLTMLAVKNRESLGHIERRRIRCFAIAPARCISLNLAVRYADVISSVVLQDDFLPRTTVALENAFKTLACSNGTSLFFDSLPCLLCVTCLKDTWTLERKMLQDPRRLYAPGRLYHIIVRKPFRCKKILPVVKTAVPVDGRFEHVVVSWNATKDHAIICILRESQSALETMAEREEMMGIPVEQRMQRQASVKKDHMEEHRAAMERAAALDVPHAYTSSSSSSSSSYGTFHESSQS